jgi:phospholipase D1/2
VPKVKTGHVVPGIPLARVKERLSQVRGALVESPLVSALHLGEHLSDLNPTGLFN